MSGTEDTLAGHRQQLRLFVASSRNRLHALLQQLQWSEAGVKADNRSTDKTPPKSTEEQLPPSCCNNPAFSVQLDKAALQQILGTEANKAGASQRLQLYEYVLQRTAKYPAFEEDNAAFAELVGVTKRDQQKRRRHRKSKPTLNEELRQLVDLQMEALQRQQVQAAVSELPSIRKRGHSRRSRCRSGSQSQERQRHRRTEKREREREWEKQRKREREREHERERHRQLHRKRRSRSRSRSSHRRKHRSRSRSSHRRKHRSRSRSRSSHRRKHRSRSRSRSSHHKPHRSKDRY